MVESLPMDLAGASGAGGFLAVILGMLVAFLVIGLLLWIYLALAFMAIGRKAKDPLAGLAWIPFIGPSLIAFRASKMHWWPWLLLIVGAFIPYISSSLSWVGSIASIIFGVYSIIWSWKMFEVVKKPGWWAILCIIPVLNLILYGIAAWSKN